jgi:hypothetical protein
LVLLKRHGGIDNVLGRGERLGEQTVKAGDVSRELRESCGAAADSVSLANADSVL